MIVFADTSGLASYADRTQLDHQRAVAVVRRVLAAKGRLVTTNYVLSELTGLLTSPLRMPKRQQLAYLSTLRTVKWVEVVHVDPLLDAAAWQLWEQRPDKEWSLTDCACFVVMQHRRLADALTADHHFTQAGFTRLLG